MIKYLDLRRGLNWSISLLTMYDDDNDDVENNIQRWASVNPIGFLEWMSINAKLKMSLCFAFSLVLLYHFVSFRFIPFWQYYFSFPATCCSLDEGFNGINHLLSMFSISYWSLHRPFDFSFIQMSWNIDVKQSVPQWIWKYLVFDETTKSDVKMLPEVKSKQTGRKSIDLLRIGEMNLSKRE